MYVCEMIHLHPQAMVNAACMCVCVCVYLCVCLCVSVLKLSKEALQKMSVSVSVSTCITYKVRHLRPQAAVKTRLHHCWRDVDTHHIKAQSRKELAIAAWPSAELQDASRRRRLSQSDAKGCPLCNFPFTDATVAAVARLVVVKCAQLCREV